MEVDFAALSSLLWRERELLEALLFKLDEQHLLFVAGRSEWMARANDEVEVVLRHIGASELRRAMAFDDAAQALGLDLNPSLREFAAATPEPWGSLFSEHLLAFTTLAGRIQALSDINRELANAAQQATDAILASMHGSSGGTPTTYARSGRTEAKLQQSAFLDEEI
ncbi:MAG: flagellar protein FlgN [Candidatus Nanopelagicales bacterium]